MAKSASILFLDNFDSFSYSLVDEFRRAGATVEVWRNDASLATLTERLRSHDLLVASPGPGRPEEAGVLVPLLRAVPATCPVFGVCLGHQALAAAFGGAVGRAPHLAHGKAAAVQHTSKGIFEGMPAPLIVGRYHSLAVSAVPDGFEVTAWIAEGGRRIPMAMEHNQKRQLGVQFHPESVLSRDGSRLIERVLAWAMA